MPGESKSFWLPAAATAAATLVIAAGAAYGVANWALPKARHYLDDRFTAINTKIELNNQSAMSALTSLPSLANTVKEIEALDAKLKKTNDTLDAIQKQISQASMAADIASLGGKLDSANSALSAIQSGLAQAKPDDAAGDATLARIEKAVGTLKDALAGTASAAKLQDTGAKLDGLKEAVATLARLTDTLKTNVAANASALAETQKSLAALDTTVKNASADAAPSAPNNGVAKLVSSTEPAITGSAKKAGEDLLVLYVSAPAPASSQQREPPRAGAIPAMSVQYEKVGSTDDNGQTALIIKKLRPILEKHRGCSIAVAGHADTLGNDDLNHTISKQRAQKVAASLKEAFAEVPVTDAAWGERNLKEWTGDETPDAINRRVDVVVRCTG